MHLEAERASRRGKKRVAAEMLAEHGEIDGKPPCFYFHRKGGTCNFDADNCRAGHHGSASN